MRLRFAIRDLLWLMTLTAMTVGWWVDHLWNVSEYRRLKEKFDKQSLEYASLHTIAWQQERLLI